MPIRFDQGIDESNDPTDLGPGFLQEATGVEYRVGSNGLWAARGRKRMVGTSATWLGLYAAGFDNDTDHIVAQDSSTFYSARILSATSMSMSSLTSAGTDPLPPVGVHYAGRHYVVNGATNLVFRESGLAISVAKMGMIDATVGQTANALGSGSMSSTLGMEYWVTEYDQTNGIESVAGATTNTGSFASAAGVSVVITGVSLNSNSTHWRIYRSSDGGVYPAGGLLTTLAIGTTVYQDTDTSTESALVPAYGSIDIGGLDYERDTMAPVLSAVGLFDGSLVGIPENSPHVIRFTPAAYPESWPGIFEIPLQTVRHDVGTAFGNLNGQLGVFTRDTVHRLTRLPREVDSAYAPSEVLSLVTDERGSITRRGVAQFTLPGRGPLLAFVARDGVWATNLAPNIQIPLTDLVAWEARVDPAYLADSVLVNDPGNRRLVFLYRGIGDPDTRRVMYLDYQGERVRVTHPDHGPLVDGVLAPFSGRLALWTADSRASGWVYAEGEADNDESYLVDSSGSISAAIRTAELFPAGVQSEGKVTTASWQHGGSGPTSASHQFWPNRVATPKYRVIDLSERGVADASLNELMVNSFSLSLAWAHTTPFPVNWVDVEGFESAPLRGSGA